MVFIEDWKHYSFFRTWKFHGYLAVRYMEEGVDSSNKAIPQMLEKVKQEAEQVTVY